MKVLVVFDSMFGNTQRVAEEVGRGLDKGVVVKRVGEVGDESLEKVNLLVVGTPVHGGRASEKMGKWLEGLDVSKVKGKKVAVFDTRVEAKGWGLKLVIGVLGYAAEKMAKQLRGKGMEVLGSEGFIVEGKEGPLKEGELERAREWASELKDNLVAE